MAGTMTSYEDMWKNAVRQNRSNPGGFPNRSNLEDFPIINRERLINLSGENSAPKENGGTTQEKPSAVKVQQAAQAVKNAVKPNLTSESYAQAVNALDKASARPTFANTYGDRLDELYEQIVNRPKFNYDVNADPLYQSLKDQYVQQGKLAMRDTVAQGAALTGGYDNTYAQQVGQQTYDAYLQNLAAAIPELYGQARDTYRMEGEALDKQYGMLGDLADDEYGKYRDALGDWQYDQQWQSEQQKYAYTNLYNLITTSGYTPSEEELQAAGMTAQEAASLKAEFEYNRDFAEKEYADKLAQQQWENEFRERQLAQDYELSLMRSYGGGGGGGYSGGGYDGGYDGVYSTSDIVNGNSDAIAAAAAGYVIGNTDGGEASENEIIDAIEYATNRNNAGKYAYQPNKNARNY